MVCKYPSGILLLIFLFKISSLLAIWSECGLESFLLYGIEIFLMTQNINFYKCYVDI